MSSSSRSRTGSNTQNNGSSHHRRPEENTEQRVQFLNTLKLFRAPGLLLDGVSIVLVSANGKTQPAKLMLSRDKFTIWIQTVKKSRTIFTKDTVHNRAIDIGEVDRVQKGQSTQQFEQAKKKKTVVAQPMLERDSSSGDSSVSTSVTLLQKLDPALSCSIVFRGAETLDFVCNAPKERELLANTLDRILIIYQQAKQRVSNEVLLLRYAWLHAADDIRGVLNEKALQKMLNEINMVLKAKDFNSNYEKFGRILGMNRSQRRAGLSFEQSCMFLHYCRRNSWMRKPVTVIWEELFGGVMNNGKMRDTVGEQTFLDKFLQRKQGHTNATIVDARKIFRKLHDMELSHVDAAAQENISWDRIGKDHFEAYLLASDNDAFNPSKEAFDMGTMDRPLSEYWINSSHNTYLIGDQYTSQSSVEMYSNALYRGCRCLELDIWDGPKSGGGTPVPVVWHGHTMTTKILFVDILKTIKVFLSFHPTSFPIILSFENHCTIPYQEVMAEQLVKVLGSRLYIPTEASLYGELPSPRQLEGMVVIKGRRPDGTEADAYDTDEYDDQSDGEPSGTSTGNDPFKHIAQEKEKQQKHGVSPTLARLVLLHGNKHRNWRESIGNPRHHMHSFSESKVRSKCRQKEVHAWIKYNQQHLSRTYPGGSRVDSSNYNPLLAWSTGCQLVALNFQTQDAYLRLNDGRFRENGNCGYVLKPSALMSRDPTYSESPVRMSIRILNGSCLPKPKGVRAGDCIDPYIKISVFDIKKGEKGSVTSYPTSIAPSNGFCPIWLQEKFSFTVEKWSVAMLQLTVLDKTKDDFIASASIPTSCLRRGIRSVKLYDVTNTRSGAFDFARLLVDIKLGMLAAEI